MPELTQRMIDAGATFIDGNGIPTRADGTPALEENRSPDENGLAFAPQAPAPDTSEWLTDPAIAFGAPYRPAAPLSSGNPVIDQNWSDLQGNPIHVGGEPPPWAGGSIQGGYPGVFSPNDRASLNGGWFTLDEYLKQAGGRVSGGGGFELAGGSGLSTNNYRLFGGTPDDFMYNGQIISRRKIADAMAPKSVLGLEGGGPAGIFPARMGPGMWLMPNSMDAMQGLNFPFQIGGPGI